MNQKLRDDCKFKIMILNNSTSHIKDFASWINNIIFFYPYTDAYFVGHQNTDLH